MPLAEWWYSTNFHALSKLSPYEIVYGQLPPKLLPYKVGTTQVAAVDMVLCTREQTLQLLKENLLKAQHRMKHYSDLKRSERAFEVGDWVYLRLQPYSVIMEEKKAGVLRLKKKIGVLRLKNSK